VSVFLTRPSKHGAKYHSFYEWRVPSRTGMSIGILLVGLIVVTVTPSWLLVRATTLALGVVFFGLFPISSRFPDYRLIASPMKWIFWKIPTHGTVLYLPS
jgi:hypothetical protein